MSLHCALDVVWLMGHLACPTSQHWNARDPRNSEAVSDAYTLVFSVVRVIMNPVTFKVSVSDLRKLKTRNARVHVTLRSTRTCCCISNYPVLSGILQGCRLLISVLFDLEDRVFDRTIVITPVFECKLNWQILLIQSSGTKY